MPDLPTSLDTIRHQPDDECHWIAFAGWLPVAVLGFLDLFHRGRYPDLEMPVGPG